MITDRLTPDALKSSTREYGDLCVVDPLATETHKSPAACLDFGDILLFFTLIIRKPDIVYRKALVNADELSLLFSSVSFSSIGLHRAQQPRSR